MSDWRNKINLLLFDFYLCNDIIHCFLLFLFEAADLHNIKASNDEKQLIFESQEFSPEDIEQIKIHRKDMLRQIDDAEARVANVDQEIWSEEMRASKMLETVHHICGFEWIHVINVNNTSSPTPHPKTLFMYMSTLFFIWEKSKEIFSWIDFWRYSVLWKDY